MAVQTHLQPPGFFQASFFRQEEENGRGDIVINVLQPVFPEEVEAKEEAKEEAKVKEKANAKKAISKKPG